MPQLLLCDAPAFLNHAEDASLLHFRYRIYYVATNDGGEIERAFFNSMDKDIIVVTNSIATQAVLKTRM